MKQYSLWTTPHLAISEVAFTRPKAVMIEKGVERPVRIAITLSNSAGIFQVDELLRRKLKNSTLAPYVEVEARLEGETEQRLRDILTCTVARRRSSAVV